LKGVNKYLFDGYQFIFVDGTRYGFKDSDLTFGKRADHIIRQHAQIRKIETLLLMKQG
jgi:hypothetical protein